MARVPEPRDERLAVGIAAWSAAGGLLVALALAAFSGRLVLDEREGAATALGALGFSVAFLAPFFVSSASFLMRNKELRRSVWLASGALALYLGWLTIFGGVGLVFAAAGAGLLSAWWLTKGRAGWLGPPPSIALVGWQLLWLGGALTVLWLRETPVCWDPTANGLGWVAETVPASNECTSDIIDTTEGLLALVCVVVGLAGMVAIAKSPLLRNRVRSRRRGSSPPPAIRRRGSGRAGTARA
jgi:hypothetical protein